MRKTKKIIALICTIFIHHATFAKPKLSDRQKEMANLLVRLNQNYMLSEPCLVFNPNLKKIYVMTIKYSDIKNGIVDFGDWDALATSTVYTFNNGLIEHTESAVFYKEKTERKTWYKLTAENDKIQVDELINCYDENGQMHLDWGSNWTYKFEGNEVKILVIEEIRKDGAWWQYEKGIRTIEHNGDYTYQYTVIEGIGEYHKERRHSL